MILEENNHNDDIAVRVNHISKSFKLPHEQHTGLKQVITGAFSRKRDKGYEIQHALKGVSFEVKKGEFFGIVGRNGSGKSTLLKILSGIYVPDNGSVEVNGSLVPFIELGVGFNPELTGRENVYLNGALLGFNRKQVSDMYDEIVAFAELEKFMDQKLKNYSSGMQVRLAFSIAIRAESDILVLDEVLAVGDEAFQRKCLDVFEKYKAQGQTIILVTHDMEAVRQFCNRSVLIGEGKVLEYGEPLRVAEKYSNLNQKSIDRDVEKLNDVVDEESKMKVELLSFDSKKKQVSFNPGEKVIIRTIWPKEMQPISVGVNIFKQNGLHVTGINTLKDGKKVEGNSIDLLVALPLRPGKYYILAESFRSIGVRMASNKTNVCYFSIIPDEIAWSGLVELPHEWR